MKPESAIMKRSKDRGGDSGASSKDRQGGYKVSRSVWQGRVVFVLTLSSVALVFGLLAFYFWRKEEKKLAEKQFESIAERALLSAKAFFLRRRQVVASLASLYEQLHPNASAYPFVTVPFYRNVARNIMDTSSPSGSLIFVPLVLPEQLTAFEDFAYDYYESAGYPNGTAIEEDPHFPNRPFGRGVSTTALYPNGTFYYIHDTEGRTFFNSPYRVFTPIFQYEGPARVRYSFLMWNLHSAQTHGEVIDTVLDCAAEKLALEDDGTACTGLSHGHRLPEPQSGTTTVVHPIFPQSDPTTLTGFAFSVFFWIEVLQDIFADEVSGVDCVLQTKDSRGREEWHTYLIENGEAFYKATGDVHDSDYDEFQETIVLSGESLFNKDSPVYTLTMYPSDHFFEAYSTPNPRRASIGAVCIIFFVSVLFFLYDYFVRRDIHKRQSVLEAKRTFMRFVSHEVRTPLNTLCMGLRLIKEEVAEGFFVPITSESTDNHNSEESPMFRATHQSKQANEIVELSQQLIGSADAAVDVLNDLLNYDKVETGGLSLECRLIPIWNLVEQTAKEFVVTAEAKEVTIHIDMEPPVATSGEEYPNQHNGKPVKAAYLPEEVRQHRLIGDPIRMTQVLRNLISNALKFTPSGGTVAIRASCALDDEKSDEVTEFQFPNCKDALSFAKSGRLVLDVVDSGTGMTPEQVSKLFRRGVQFDVNALQAGQGSGLGLYIAKGIVIQHGGTLEASSPGLGLGTTFTATVPLYHVPEASLPSNLRYLSSPTDMEEALGNGDSPAANLSILVVDDAMANRKLLQRLLERRGHACVTASNGVKAVDRVKESIAKDEPFDTILLDYEMLQNGPTSAQEMRALGCTAVIVGITGNVFEDDVAYFKKCGADYVLPKPVDLGRLEALWIERGLSN